MVKIRPSQLQDILEMATTNCESGKVSPKIPWFPLLTDINGLSRTQPNNITYLTRFQEKSIFSQTVLITAFAHAIIHIK
jgi:hypothetical protein